MKRTTPIRVFVSIYLGVLLTGLIALFLDAIYHIHFHWTHGYAIHGYDNFTFWLQTGFAYGLYGLPFVFVGSYAIAWLINLFAKGSR